MSTLLSGITFNLTESGDIDALIAQGCDVMFQLLLEETEGVPLDVTGWGAEMTIRRRANDSEIVAQFTAGNGRVTIGTTDGVISFNMSDEDCAALDAIKGVYDVRLTNAAGFTWQAQSGKCEIARSVTR